MNVPYVDLAGQHAPIKDELLDAVGKVLEEGKYVLGPQVQVFEKAFAQMCGVRFALGLNSGTDALILALRALGIGPGDEVITVANSFVSSASCIVLAGARPVFVDVREDANIDPAAIERSLTPKTKAIIPVHWTGRPAAMDEILAVARKHRLAVIEDAAQAVCAQYQGKAVGSFGDAGCFSLHPLKTLNACGDGGVLVTDNEELYKKISILRDNGFESRTDCVAWSNNSRLDTIHAAMLLVKIKYVHAWTEQRRANARFYQDRLRGLPEVQVPQEEPQVKSVYHTFVVRADRRDDLQAYLDRKRIRTKIHYPVPLHLQSMAAPYGYQQGDLPLTELQSRRILSLPVYAGLKQEELDYVVESIKEFYKAKGSA